MARSVGGCLPFYTSCLGHCPLLRYDGGRSDENSRRCRNTRRTFRGRLRRATVLPAFTHNRISKTCMKVLPAALALCCLLISWCYAAAYWSASNRGIPVEFYPFWNASRTVLHHGNPYSNEVTVENQIAAYGGPSRSVGLENEQRFAYPVSALLPLLPLGLISFPIANTIVFFLFVAATILAVGWLRRTWDRTTAF